jgi:ribosome biogenesis GTPase / thiamine phosphate phosphatase
MSSTTFSLLQLGWRACFSQQLSLADLENCFPARVCSVQRSVLFVLCEQGERQLHAPRPDDDPVAVGDWLLVETTTLRVSRRLERATLLARDAAGAARKRQPIAANLDTVFVVTSCNEEFNASRLERYLVLARAAHIEPVVVLTKVDLCSEPDTYVRASRGACSDAPVLAVDSNSPAAISALAPWLGAGKTSAFIGSSGVGKSTLVNSLLERSAQSTGAIRAADARGRHTTTSRQMFATAQGAWIIDTPGMRELKVGAAEAGVTQVFDELQALAARCRFRDCRHEGEAGCAVIAAVAHGALDARRLASYLKLQRETENAAMALHERRDRDRRFGRMRHAAERVRRRQRERGRD